MSKRSRRSDNSKRQQPVQQQRAQAASQMLASKQTKAEVKRAAKGEDSKETNGRGE